MTGAWGDDMVYLDRDDRETPWFGTQKGKFACAMCDKVLTTRRGLGDHARKHGEDYALKVKRDIRAEERAILVAGRIREEDEAKRLAARAVRKVVLSTREVDEIVSEINSLIGMMEPYWSQGNAADGAQVLIAKLEALAEGKPYA